MQSLHLETRQFIIRRRLFYMGVERGPFNETQL
jgi:hypothetical protein